MKRKTLKSTLRALIICIIIFSITSCSAIDDLLETFGIKSSTETATNIAMVISPTATETRPDLMLTYDYIYKACYNYSYMCSIIDDGDPYVAHISDLSKAEKTIGISAQNRKLDAEHYVKEFIKEAEKYTARTPEKDVAKAIRIGADCLYDCSGEKFLIIIDNGISTAGLVSFKTFRGFDAEQALSAFDDTDLPDLTNINVVWYGLGSSVAPQDELSGADLKNLECFWDGYLKRAGAVYVSFPKKVTVNTTYDNSSLPYVSPVEVTPQLSKIPDFESVTSAAVASDNERDKTFSQALSVGIKLDEATVRFMPDSYELKDRNEAINKMTPFAEYLKANTDEEIIIFGCTATAGTNDECVRFSKGRADTIAKLFVELGVGPAQMNTKGLGYEHEFHIPDVNPDGTLNESAAKNNRCAIIMDVKSAKGREFI